jgi:hypothetical protein
MTTNLSRLFEEAKNHAIEVGIGHAEIELDEDKFGRGLLFLAGPFRIIAEGDSLTLYDLDEHVRTVGEHEYGEVVLAECIERVEASIRRKNRKIVEDFIRLVKSGGLDDVLKSL